MIISKRLKKEKLKNKFQSKLIIAQKTKKMWSETTNSSSPQPKGKKMAKQILSPAKSKNALFLWKKLTSVTTYRP